MRLQYQYLLRTSLRFIIPLLALMAALFGFATGNILQGVLASSIACLSIFAEIVTRNIETIEKNRELIPPDINAHVTRNGDDFHLTIQPNNETPFRYKYWVKTVGGKDVGPVLWMEPIIVYPDAAKTPKAIKIKIELDQIKNDYMELHIRYGSIYADKHPGAKLDGHFMVTRYSIKDGQLITARWTAEALERLAKEYPAAEGLRTGRADRDQT